MAGANISTMSAILKDLYLPPVTRQLNDDVFLFSRLTKTSENIVGRRVVLPLDYGRTGGIGVRGEDWDLPAAGAQKYTTLNFDFSSFYGTVRVTGQAQAKTKSEAGAFLEVLKSELDGVRRDLKKDLARQIYGDGTGQIVQCGTTTSNVISVASDEQLRKGQIYVGMVIDLADNAGAAIANGSARTVTAVSVASKTVTIADGGTSPTTSASHYIYRSGGTGGTVFGLELNGLNGILPTAPNSFGGLNAATAGNEYWDNLRQDAGGALSLDLMEQVWGQLKIAGSEPSLVLCSHGMRRIYAGLLQSQLRYTDPMQLNAGFKALEFNNQPLVGDLEANFGKMYFIEEAPIKVYQNQDWHFLDQDNSALKWVPNRDAWTAVLARYFQIGTNRRNTSAVLYNLTGDSKGY